MNRTVAEIREMPLYSVASLADDYGLSVPVIEEILRSQSLRAA